MKSQNIPYAREVFPGAFYPHGGNFIDAQGDILESKIGYNEIMRNAGKYIEIYKNSNTNTPFNIDKYNFSVFRANDNTSLETMHYGYIRFMSDSVNSILGIPKNTQINNFFSKKRKKIDVELGQLGTQIYPDTDYMVSLNYEDFPIGFLGFNITKEGNVLVMQIQSGKVVDETSTFYSKKHHLLDGFDWAKVLIHFFEDYLKDSNFSGKITIQSAENNGYYKKFKAKGRLDSLEKRYNTTASDLGYHKSHNKGNSLKEALNFIKEI